MSRMNFAVTGIAYWSRSAAWNKATGRMAAWNECMALIRMYRRHVREEMIPCHNHGKD